jgi:hypothetical protein
MLAGVLGFRLAAVPLGVLSPVRALERILGRSDGWRTLFVGTHPEEVRMFARSSKALVVFTLAAALAAAVASSGATAAHASTSCGIVSASGRAWIVVAKNVPCAKAKAVTRGFAARTAALRAGQQRVVTTSLLPGFTCLLVRHGKPGGSCSTAGARKSVLWLSAT